MMGVQFKPRRQKTEMTERNAEIARLRWDGMRLEDIAGKFGITMQRVQAILKREAKK